MPIPHTVARLLCCALLTMTVSCGANGLKFPKLNLMSAFKKDADDDSELIAESKENAEEEKAASPSSGARKGGNGSSSPEKSGDTDSLENMDLETDPLALNAGGLPVIVKPRQPSVDITPPTKEGKPLPDVAPEAGKDDENGGLRPRRPTLEILPPGRP